MAKKEQSGQLRSSGYCVFHEILCVIATLLLFFCLSNTVALRSYCRSDSLSEGLRASRISDAKVPFSGKSVTDFVLSGYVNDQEVLPEDIQAAADGMELPEFLAEKIAQQAALLRGDSDEAVQITPEEISGKLEQISDELHESCKLIIEDSDREAIENELAKPLATFNSVSNAFSSTKAGRLFQRFGVSIFSYIAGIILLLLLLRRWSSVRKRSGKDGAGCFKGMGITVLIPSLVGLINVLAGATSTWFVSDNVVGLYPFWKALRLPYWWVTVTGISFALFLLELCAFLRARRQKSEQVSAPVPAVMPSAPPVPVLPGTKKLPADHKFCMHCGKPINANAKFCIYCGKDQTAILKPDTAASQESDGPAPVSLQKPDDGSDL